MIFRNVWPNYRCGCNCCRKSEYDQEDKVICYSWDFTRRNPSECETSGGEWVQCAQSGCDCPPCTAVITFNGLDIKAPDAEYRVLFVGDRDPALHPFGYPVGTFGPISKVRASSFAGVSWSCETNTLAIQASISVGFEHDRGLIVGNTYFSNFLEFPPELIALTRNYFYVYQGEPDFFPCFDKDHPPLVASDITELGSADNVENDQLFDLLAAGITVDISCEGPYLCVEE